LQTEAAHVPSSTRELELKRPVRAWEFLDAVGQRAAIFGNEAGRLEAWVYPIKLFRDFKLRFHLKDRVLRAEDYAREVVMHPEGPSIVYATAGFTVTETLVVPPDEPGGIIRLDVDTFEPLWIEAQFVRDFQLMWPAAVGGTYIEWDEHLNVFTLGHEQKIYVAVVGSPHTAAHTLEFFSNSGSSDLNSLSLQPLKQGRSTQFILLAGSIEGPPGAQREYDRLLKDSEEWQKSAHKYYSDYLNKTISLKLPDAQLEAAYDWSRISVIQGLVNNPLLGAGLIAGYRTAGDSSRPGFSWFFGRDSLWTALALDSVGDFATTRTALEFITKFQRADGKIEHEVPQTASLVPWFKEFRYAYAAADSTPLYVLAFSDYVSASGDIEFLNQHWDSLWRAYLFLHSTYNAQGLPKNLGIGHGWIEGGPLFPMETELYQSGLGAASLQALAGLAALAQKPELQKQLESEYIAQKQIINDAFWSKEKNTLVFALNEKNQQVESATVLSTVPMWFDVFDSAKAGATINHLAAADHATDWGMRILSNQNSIFDPTGYHFGSVWPLFTGWASVGEYRFHRPLPAYANLLANAQLALDGSLGHVTEVLSGTYYEPLPTSSPHQIWSSAMVVLPVIRGLLDISSSATEQKLVVAPHVPADWNSWSANNVPTCGGAANLTYKRTPKQIGLEVEWRVNSAKTGQSPDHSPARGTATGRSCTLIFSPAISLHAKVGKNIKVEETLTDKHPTVSMQLRPGANSASIPVANDFGIAVPSPLPPLGGPSGNLKIVKEDWSADRNNLRLEIQGLPGHSYTLKAYGARILTINGGQILNSAARKSDTQKSDNQVQEIELIFPSNKLASGPVNQVLDLYFSGK
jgi:GH15 family glucan-1,4-alpha-glucosidase